MGNKVLKKKQIHELLDSDGIIIGTDTQPHTGPNLETKANRTTDYNAKVHGQNYKNDFLGRFGFYFYEGEDDKVGDSDLKNDLAKIMYDRFVELLKYYKENPENLESDYEQHLSDGDNEPQLNDTDYEWGEKIMQTIKPHLEDALDDESINESKVAEDRVVDKEKDARGDKIKSSKDSNIEVRDKQIDKVAGVLKKLPKNQINKLIDLLENNGDSLIEPYYNDDFNKKLFNLLNNLGFEDIEKEVNGVSFHNPNYGGLTNSEASEILDFIKNYGYDSDDFIVRGSVLFYPENF